MITEYELDYEGYDELEENSIILFNTKVKNLSTITLLLLSKQLITSNVIT